MSAMLAAARRLEQVLLAENAALAGLDHLALPGLLQEKLAASQDLASAVERPGPQTPEGAALALRLRDLAAENQRLLAGAIDVQGRVMRLVAGAVRHARMQAPPRYGAAGQPRHDGGAMALLTRA